MPPPGPPRRAAPPRAAMTMVASQALSFADMFDTAFRGGLQGPEPHRIELTRPSGGSTAGGKQILQHIRLVPLRGGPSTVMGSVNGVAATVELRSFEYIAENHRRRFKGAALPVDQPSYDRILRAMESFFSVQRFATTVLNDPPLDAEGDYDADPRQGVAVSAMVISGILIVVAILAGLLLLLKR